MKFLIYCNSLLSVNMFLLTHVLYCATVAVHGNHFILCEFPSSDTSPEIQRFWTVKHSLPHFDVHVTMNRDKFLKIKPTRCTNFSNLFLEWNSVCFGQFLCPSPRVFFHCTHSNGICHTGLLTACEQDQVGTQFQPDAACRLSADLYVIYHCCVYSEKKLLVMDRGTVRNI